MTTILGIKIDNRDSLKFQQILTNHGCEIRTRLGIHPTGEYGCINYGIIMIDVVSNVNEIYDALSEFWEVQVMKF